MAFEVVIPIAHRVRYFQYPPTTTSPSGPALLRPDDMDAAFDDSSSGPTAISPVLASCSPIPTPHQCHICSKYFRRRQSLKSHMFTHSSEKPFPCAACHKSFVSGRHLANHVRVHTGERPFQCDIGGCDAAYTTNSSLRRHQLDAHGVDTQLPARP
ncbi:C2H2-type domain-containing protein [Plasmodiophora brassicae]